MIPSVAAHEGGTVLDALYHQLLQKGVQYFLQSSRLEIVGSTSPSASEIVCEPAPGGGVAFNWLDKRYLLTNHNAFSDHRRRMLQSISKVLSNRYEVLFGRDVPAQNLPAFGGIIEDRYVSAFLQQGHGRTNEVATPDRASEAIEVLRISALSSYEDKHISTGALLFGPFPDACHSLPPFPAGAIPYSSELTSIRSFHRICDGLKTVALVDSAGLMVELIDIHEWARPYNDLELPVPAAHRYQTHCRATLCGGHICLVLTPNGEIKIFGEGVQLFNFFEGRWRLTDAVVKFQQWEIAVGRRDLAARLFSSGLNLAEHRRGGMFVILDDALHVRQLINEFDLLENRGGERAGAKNRLHYLLQETSATELSAAVLESVAQIDGSVILDRDSNLLAFGAILRHRFPAGEDEEIGEGGRTAAAIGASQFGDVLMVSEGGQLSFYQKGHLVWSL